MGNAEAFGDDFADLNEADILITMEYNFYTPLLYIFNQSLHKKNMNLERNTLVTLRGMCSREPELFRGYSRLRKNELVHFMEEKINNQTVIDDDGEETDVEIENAQEEEILEDFSIRSLIIDDDGEETDIEIFEDFSEQSEQSMNRALIVENNILQHIIPPLMPMGFNLPPVGPPVYPPPPPTIERIRHRMYILILENFPQIEKIELAEEMQQKDLYKNMSFTEFYDLIFDKWWSQESNMQIFIDSMEQELTDNEFDYELNDFMTEIIVENTCDSLVDSMWDTLELNGPECPVCYECKPGRIMESKVGTTNMERSPVPNVQSRNN